MNFIFALASVLGNGFVTLAQQGRWKLIPALGFFLLLSGLLVIVKAVAPIAPFVYSLF